MFSDPTSQLYIKARGLSDAVINRLTTFNSSHLRLDRLSSILKTMKLSTISPTPLHFEFIVQFEGKAVLCYHLNQTTFHNLTDGNSKYNALGRVRAL